MPQALVNEGVLASSLIESGSVILPVVEFDSGEGDNERLVDPEALDYLVRLLQRETDMRVYIVSHLSQPERALEALLEQSENRAQLIRELLIEKGIDGSRVTAAGVGPLAPWASGRGCCARISPVSNV